MAMPATPPDNRVREHFEQEAREFDDLIVRLIPRYDEMLGALIAAIPFPPGRAIRVIDLGCGTGTLALRIRERFPHSPITCLDFAENMLDLARTKLSGEKEMRFVQADFNTYVFKETYDVAVSSLALHHLLTGKAKLAFYRRLYAALAHGGVFWTADAALGATSALNEMYMERWKDFMRRSMSEQQIEERFAKDSQEDHPAPLADHFRWLEAAGFVSPEVVWKYFYCGVYGAHKL
jgi:tRNA (cmo5U34)-methyltransferase